MSSDTHHKNRQCPLEGCDYHGGDLKRHLLSKKHRDEVDPPSVDALVQLSDKGKIRKGKNKLLYRWCPIEKCNFLTCYLRKHLMQGHGLTNSKTLDRLRKNAEVYEPNQLPSGSGLSASAIEDDDSGSEQDDDDYSLPTARAFFEAQRITTNRQRFLVDFYTHLGTVDEGQKTERIRLQHASQVRKILEDIDPGGKGIEPLAADQGRAVWNGWIVPRLQENSVAAGTLISYLGSFAKFLKFVVRRHRRRQSTKDGPFISENTCESFCDILDAISGWRATIVKESAVQRNEHYLKECESRLTKEDFNAFLRSPVIAEAESLFSDNTRHGGILQFVRARDYLITRLAVSCGTRPKPLETATVDHFRSARRDSEFRDCFVMLVPKHKRQIDGPAIVTMDERLHGFVSFYIRDIRPLVVDSSDEDHLFLTKEGRPFPPGTIGTRVTHLWNRTGVRPDLRVSCTDFRKGIVTMIQEANKNQRIRTGRLLIDNSDVRKLLCHSEQTAAIWYMRENLTAIAARAHSVLERIREGRVDEGNADDASGSDIEPRLETETGTSPEMETGATPDAKPVADKDQSIESPVSPNIVPVLLPPPIETRVLPNIAPARSPFPVEVRVPPNVGQGPLLPPQRPSTVTICTGRPRERRDWSREDSKLFVAFVKQFDTCPRKREVFDAFNASTMLKVILEREGLHRCMQKVQSTFKGLQTSGKF